ncbi:MAG: SGNH/GDSL hydrolase family protein [Spirochaeta sp.]|jgi:lysophospholipase L1-like esterase|nr:SGNH/GDSL hydrolase family protein [Spirochaeta sp.]
MKTVLCYGDSNTWGYNPATTERYGPGERWTQRLQKALGDQYTVIEEGQNGRTTVHDDPVEGQKNGMTYLTPCLESHKPVDLVVLLLGTNDLKHRFGLPAGNIAQAAGQLVRVIQTSEFGPGGTAPEVLLLAPPPVAQLTRFADTFAGAPEKSLHLGTEYRLIAEARGCPFLDTASVIASSDLDGIHLDADQLPRLAAAVHEQVIAALS